MNIRVYRLSLLFLAVLLALPLMPAPPAYAQETEAVLYETVKTNTPLFANYNSLISTKNIPETGVVFGVVEVEMDGENAMGKIAAIPFGSGEEFAGWWLFLEGPYFSSTYITRHEHEITFNGGGSGEMYSYMNDEKHSVTSGHFEGCNKCGYRTGGFTPMDIWPDEYHDWEAGRCTKCQFDPPRPVIKSMSPQDAVITVNQPFAWQVAVEYPADGQSYETYWVMLDAFANQVDGGGLSGNQIEHTPWAAGKYTLFLIVKNSARDLVVRQSVSFTVKDEVPVTEIRITPKTLRVEKGKKAALTVTVLPDDATNKSLTWTSHPPGIVAVDANTGEVHGSDLGTATVTATAKDGSGVTGTCTVTVHEPEVKVTEITIMPADINSLKVGLSQQFNTWVLPADATNKKVTWSSSAPAIATVDASTGLVKAVSPGTATITAFAQDGSGVKGEHSLKVYPQPPAEFSYEHTADGITITGYTGSAAEVKVPGEIEGRPVTRIGGNAFSEKTGIARMVLPGSIQSIGNNAFNGCSSLAGINLPEGLLTLGGRAFWGCGQLSGITLPQSLTSIDWGVFEHCSSLTNLKIPDGVTKIGSRAFYDCSSLSAVGLPPGLTEIENSLFLGCTSLTGITIPDGVTSIGISAFQNCDGLRDIKLPGGLTSIGSIAFYSCKSLNRITIRAHVSSFGEDVFKGAPVTIFGDVPSAAKDYADKNSIPFVDLAKGIPGDANNDLEVNVEDLISLMNYLVKDTPCPSMKNADANQDSKVDHQNAVAIINMIVGD